MLNVEILINIIPAKFNKSQLNKRQTPDKEIKFQQFHTANRAEFLFTSDVMIIQKMLRLTSVFILCLRANSRIFSLTPMIDGLLSLSAVW